MKSFFRRFALSTVVVAALSWQSAAAQDATADDLLTIGSDAPALDVEHWVQDGEGKFGKVTKFEKGKVYVVEFWATWCPPCIKSIPHLTKLQKKHKNIVVLGVAGSERGGKDPLEAFVK
ncbi:MAG: TlpA family protein disulfide reductase [Planctomycetota bacterium]